MRFRWYLYLVGNGMDPGVARDVVKGELSHSKDKQMHIDALYRDLDRKSTRLNSSHSAKSRMPSSA